MEDKNKRAKLDIDLVNLTNRFQDEILKDELSDDLKKSLIDTIDNMGNFIKNISNIIENTLSDDEIKNTSKELFINIFDEFEKTIKNTNEIFTIRNKLNTSLEDK